MQLSPKGTEGAPPARWDRARADLADRDAFSRFVAERSRDVLVRATPLGVLLYASAAARKVLGFDPAELVGADGLALVHPGDRESARLALSDLLKGVPGGSPIVRVRRSDGSFVWLEFVATAVRDRESGDVVEIVLAARDVTHRRLAELAMAESERRFRATFEQAAVGVGHCSLDGRWLRVNERLCHILGRSREELLARSFTLELEPEDAEAFGEACNRLSSGAGDVHRSEVRVRRAGGATWADVTMSLVRDDGGAPEYFLLVLEDATARRKSEDDLAAARHELAHVEKLSALGTLVGGVAHEVKTPLTYASNHLHWIDLRLSNVEKRPLGREDLDAVRKAIADSLEGIDRINRLVQDLRRFSSREATSLVESSLSETVREALDLFRATHRGTHVIDADLAPALVARIDPIQIQQVVLNLLDNAADAMPAGGRIRLVARADGDAEALVVVEDAGGGIPEEAQRRLFEPFYTTKKHGMGLGLSIVKRILEAHKGAISFATSPGQGSAFTIRLPLSRRES